MNFLDLLRCLRYSMATSTGSSAVFTLKPKQHMISTRKVILKIV